jgi:WD40 repeat protein
MFQKQKEITGHSGAIYCCLATDEFIYSGGADHYVTRWNVTTGEQDKFAIKFEHSIYALEIINDDILVVGLSSGGMHFFDLKERKEIKFFTQHTKAVFSIKYNSHKNQLYVTDAEGNLSVWNTVDYSLMIYIPLDCGKIRKMGISPTGDFLALACQDGMIRILDTEYFNELKTINAHKDGTTSILFHPLNADLLISGGKDALIKVWRWNQEELVETIVAHNYAVYDLIALDEGQTFVSASRDKTVKIWNTNDFSFVQKLELKTGGHRHSVNKLSAINENTFVSCSDDSSLKVWESISE